MDCVRYPFNWKLVVDGDLVFIVCNTATVCAGGEFSVLIANQYIVMEFLLTCFSNFLDFIEI